MPAVTVMQASIDQIIRVISVRNSFVLAILVTAIAFGIGALSGICVTDF